MQMAWVSLIAGQDFEKIMGKTERGHVIHLRVFANDEPVNTQAFFEWLENNFQYHVQQKVAELAKDAQLENLTETVARVEKELSQTIREKFKAIGIELHDEEEW